MTADDVLLEVAGLRTRYPVRRSIADRLARRPRQWVSAVDDVSFSLRRGEMVALVGESGCGKTTTAQTILRMVEPAGRHDQVRRAGHHGVVAAEAQAAAARHPDGLPGPVRVARPAVPGPADGRGTAARARHRRVARPSASKLVAEALERAGLAPATLYLDRYPHELSGGQRQRVAIAAALALDPVLLLADEPVSMLDVSVRAGVLALLDGLRKDGRLGVLMITHDLSTAAHFADRIAVMYLGRIVEYGPARQVVSDPQHPYTKALLSVVPRPRPSRSAMTPQILSGETPNPVAIPPGCRFRPRCPIAEARCAESTRSSGRQAAPDRARRASRPDLRVRGLPARLAARRARHARRRPVVAARPAAGRAGLRLVGAWLPGAGGDADRVPGVDGHDQADQRGRSGWLNSAADGAVGLVGDVGVAASGHVLGERQRGALARR